MITTRKVVISINPCLHDEARVFSLIQTPENSYQFDTVTRRYNDTVTWLAEVMPGSMRTPFEYRLIGNELYSDCNSPMGPIFNDSIEQAKYLPGYEQRRRSIEKEEYQDMIAMMRGELPNTMVVISDFPPELMDADEDVGGYNVSRKQTMLRVITKSAHNKLMMYSQSLDRSDRRALEDIYLYLGFTPVEGELLGQRINLEVDQAEQQFLVDELTGVYDRSLERHYGGSWYAGVRGGQRINTYDFVCGQTDLINAYLASTDKFVGGINDYSLAAAMKARFTGESSMPSISYKFGSPVSLSLAIHEMEMAGVKAQSRGEVFSGCGSSLGSTSPEDQYSQAGYGNKADTLPDDKYGSRYFKCPKISCAYVNQRPKDRLIPRCKKCGTDVSCK